MYPDNRITSYREGLVELSLDHIRSWGAVGFETATRLAASSPAEVHSLAVFFQPETDAAIRAQILQRHDVSAVLGKLAPVGFVRLTAEQAKSLGREGAVTKIVLAGDSGRSRVAELPIPRLPNSIPRYPVPNSSLNHFSNSVFTEMGFDGQGEHIGVVEARALNAVTNSPREGCRIFEDHDAFQAVAGIHYLLNDFAECTSDSDCSFCGERAVIEDGSATSEDGKCMSFASEGKSYCVSRHTSFVASRISSNHQCMNGFDPNTFDDQFPNESSYWIDEDGKSETRDDRLVCKAGPFNSAGADIYITNNFAATTLSGSPSPDLLEMEESYAYLATVGPGGSGVRLVNESFGAEFFREVSGHGVLTDWYARYQNMLFVFASGNDEPAATNLKTFCVSFNGLCVGAIEVGTDIPPYGFQGPSPIEPDLTNLRFANFSMWENIGFEGTQLFELEKPDIVADGVFSHVADLGGASPGKHWIVKHGTSFAAPAVVGLLGQFRHSCRDTPREIDFDETYEIRAATMYSQWDTSMHRLETAAANPAIASSVWPPVCNSSGVLGGAAAPAYPSADGRLGCDYKAGVGMLDARRLASFCRDADNPNPPPDEPDESGSVSTTVPSGGGDPIPPDFFDPENPLGYLDNRTTEGTTPQPPVPTSGSPRSVGSGVGSSFTLETLAPGIVGPSGGLIPSGTRVRASLAYMSCPGGSAADVLGQSISDWSSIGGGGYALPSQTPPISDLQPAVDFNLVLVGTLPSGKKELIYASEALFDTEEGFDAIVPNGKYETLSIELLKPSNYVGCGGHDEPVALSWGVWWAYAP